MGYNLNILVLCFQAEVPGHSLRSFPNKTDHTLSMSPSPQSYWTVVFMDMTVVNSLHWSRGRATGRGAKVTSCAECFLRAAPNRCQPTINRGLLTKVSFLTPSSFSINQSSTLHHDKRTGNSLPTFKAIGRYEEGRYARKM